MINKFETTTDFPIKKIINDEVLIEYSNLREIVQGGPEIGNLTINGNKVSNEFFGGPYLYDKDYLYIPKYSKRFFNVRFLLCKINFKNLKINIISEQKNLFYLYKLEDGKIYYYEDVAKKKYDCIKINEQYTI